MTKLNKLPSRLTKQGQKSRQQVSNSWRDDKKSSTARGYGYKWQQARLDYLSKHPLCVFCKTKGFVTEANVVDHIIPHNGDQKLFWNRNNWQSLCTSCHSSVKQKQEKQAK